MAGYTFERLSAQDLTFLEMDSEVTPMHVGAVAILETGPLRSESGGVDIEAYRHAVASVLHRIPRYRQKLAWVPLDRWPVWVDDRHFDLGYHVRHLSAPRPGTLAQLKELAGRILARPLDRSRPLWEIWVIEGIEGGDQFALINKVHHCMIDGAAGAELSQILFSPSAKVEDSEVVPYLPRPEPTGSDLLRDAIKTRASLPWNALRRARSLIEDGGLRLDEVSRRGSALAELAGWSLQPSSDTPINGELSPHRRFDWITMPLDDVREIRRQLGCTVNDIVLGTVAGALRRYLFRRRVDPAKLDFRVSAPVNVRPDGEAKSHGNHVSSWILRLPLGEDDPLGRLDAIQRSTEALKFSQSALGFQTLIAAAEWLPADLIGAGMGLAQGPVNMVVTNVPGPQFPLFSVGARLLGMYPAVPLLPSGGLGVALFSYEGKLCWGFHGDRDLVPDLDSFVDDTAAAFEELRGATVARFMAERTAPSETEGRSVVAEKPEKGPVPVAVIAAPAAAGAAEADATAENSAAAG